MSTEASIQQNRRSSWVKEARVPACYHCGEPCAPVDVPHDGKHFCCGGCKTVYELLAENNLCGYYQLDPTPGAQQSSDADQGADNAQFAYLDEPEVLAKLAHYLDDDRAIVTLEVPSIHCASCVWLLEHLERLTPAVESSEVNFPKKRVTLRVNRKNGGLAAVVAAMQRIGYAPRLNLDATTQEEPTRKRAQRSILLRLGVAGFAFGNTMLLSFPDYVNPGGVSAEFEALFGYLSLAIALPTFLYAGWPWLHAAWASVRSKRLTIDVPLALGMVAMLVRSSFEVLSASGAGYFDSLTGLIFFLLVGRFFQQKTYDFLSFERDYRSYFPLAVSVVQDDGTVNKRPLDALRPGNRIRLRNGEILPADAYLESADCTLDLAFLTGEALPVERQRGARVYAGSRHLGPSADYLVDTPTEQSQLTQLWNHPSFRKTERGQLQRLINRVGRVFTLGVLGVAGTACLYWWAVGDLARGLDAFTAVLIIACPCALAFAAPFTFGHLMRILGKHGLYLKSADVLEDMAALDTLVFDKTGTLTDPGQYNVAFVPAGQQPALSDAERLAISAVAAQSTHPLSRALSRALSHHADAATPQLAFWDEVTGRGVSGEVAGVAVKLGSASWAGAPANKPEAHQESRVYVNLNGVHRGYFQVQGQLRPGYAQWLSELSKPYTQHLLSGDQPGSAPQLATWFPPTTHADYQQTPEAKLDRIKALQQAGHKVAMLGDGLNDAGALRQAHVGISVTEHTANFTPAADAILAGAALPQLPKFLKLSRQSIQIVQVLFGFSIAYNLVGTAFAVQGLLSPVVAAVLMPVSSITIIALATGFTYHAARRAGLQKIISQKNSPE